MLLESAKQERAVLIVEAVEGVTGHFSTAETMIVNECPVEATKAATGEQKKEPHSHHHLLEEMMTEVTADMVIETETETSITDVVIETEKIADTVIETEVPAETEMIADMMTSEATIDREMLPAKTATENLPTVIENHPPTEIVTEIVTEITTATMIDSESAEEVTMIVMVIDVVATVDAEGMTEDTATDVQTEMIETLLKSEKSLN